jgi:hypothetical protein
MKRSINQLKILNMLSFAIDLDIVTNSFMSLVNKNGLIMEMEASPI